MVERVEWFLFLGVLANQAGVPVPVTPWLLAVGVLAASGHVSLIVLVAAVAVLGADLAWYGLGRWHGEERWPGCFGFCASHRPRSMR
jgi:membrane protein DedA with SNARE-associated domain